MSQLLEFLDDRPIVIALAGPNGAGKSTFYESFLAASGLRFVNADTLAASLGMNAYEAAELAASIRRTLVSQGGHDVPDEKLRSRFERSQANLQRAIQRLPHVIVYSNQDFARPFQMVELYAHGEPIDLRKNP